MATIAELLIALQHNDADTQSKLKALLDEKERKAVLARARTSRSYYKKRALLVEAPDYVPKKRGRQAKKPQAEPPGGQ